MVFHSQRVEHLLRLRTRQLGSQLFHAQCPKARHAAKSPQQLLCGAFAYTRNFRERCTNAARGSSLAMKCHGEAMCLVANLLDQVQHGRMPLEHDRIVLATQHVKNFFFLGDARHRLVDDFELVERLRRRVQLADSAVDQNQARQWFLFLLQAAVAALHRFAHAGEIVPQQAGIFLRAFRHLLRRE